MDFPPAFADRFPVWKNLAGEQYSWLVTDRNSRQFVYKLLINQGNNLEPVLERVTGLAANCTTLVAPVEYGQIDHFLYQITPFFPTGSLRDYIQGHGNLSDAQLRTLILDISTALNALHTPQDDQSYLVHGDVKPSNILISTTEERGIRFGLADFDAALLVTPEGARGARRITPRYASPERLGGGSIGITADYWSVGMVLLEALFGHHPFDGQPESDIRDQLLTQWQPDFTEIDGMLWRALSGGLMARENTIRWTHEKILLCLNEDPSVISEGLQLAGERATEVPFIVGNKPVYSARELAKALLVRWEAIG